MRIISFQFFSQQKPLYRRKQTFSYYLIAPNKTKVTTVKLKENSSQHSGQEEDFQISLCHFLTRQPQREFH